MSKKVLKVATFGLSGLLMGKKKSATVPEGPKVMPLADDDAVMRAKRRAIANSMVRGGRTSTMLTTDSDTLGG
jgi:hypothetical protein